MKHSNRLRRPGTIKRPLLVSALGLLVIIGLVACGQDKKSAPLPDPAKIKSVVLYDVDPRGAKNYSDLITNASSYALKLEEIQSLFAHTRYESRTVWKGAFLGVVRLEDGKECHLAISYFGGFARILETGECIKFDDASRAEYERIKTAAFAVFIPERYRRIQGK